MVALERYELENSPHRPRSCADRLTRYWLLEISPRAPPKSWERRDLLRAGRALYRHGFWALHLGLARRVRFRDTPHAAPERCDDAGKVSPADHVLRPLSF
jgi:hypothetical protein